MNRVAPSRTESELETAELDWFRPLEEEPMLMDPENDPEVDLPGCGPDGPTFPGFEPSARPSVPAVHAGGLVDAWLDDAQLETVRYAHGRAQARRRRDLRTVRELPADVDASDLAQAGWGIVLPDRAPPGVREALAPLLRLRARQAGRLYKTLTLHRGDDARRFLEERYSEAPGVVNPSRVPYYLLIVGGPETASFSFQHQLGIGHAVGRLCFDRPDAYRRYAEAVVAAENRTVQAPSCALFAPRHQGDVALERMNEHLLVPLLQHFRDHVPDAKVASFTGRDATKARLTRVLSGNDRADVVVIGCHGLSTDMRASSVRHQGALICQDSSDQARDALPERCFSADDVAALDPSALRGTTVFLVACHGLGTPLEDSFASDLRAPERRRLARRPQVSALPQTLLEHGATAVVGHVDRAWTLGFSWLLRGEVRPAADTHRDIVGRLFAGQRCGHALRPAVRRYTALAGHAAPLLERALRGEPVDGRQLRVLRLAMNDARNLILLGDPAARAVSGCPRGPASSPR